MCSEQRRWATHPAGRHRQGGWREEEVPAEHVCSSRQSTIHAGVHFHITALLTCGRSFAFSTERPCSQIDAHLRMRFCDVHPSNVCLVPELSKEAVERPHQAPAKQVGRQAVSDAADAGLGCTAAAAAAAVVRDRIGNVAAHP